MLNYARNTADASEEQKYGREPKFVYPRLKKVVKPNQTVKLTMTIPKYNDYDYSAIDSCAWINLQKTKIRKIIKPDGSHFFIIAGNRKKSNLPILKINNTGDVFVYKKSELKKYNHSNLPIFYEDIVNSVKKINAIFFPLTQGEKESIKNSKLLNRIGRFFTKLFRK